MRGNKSERGKEGGWDRALWEKKIERLGLGWGKESSRRKRERERERERDVGLILIFFWVCVYA